MTDDDNYQRFEDQYGQGDVPWDSGVVPPEVVALVEGDTPLKPGRALDVGCGPGTSAIYLAQHGWQVTGVDFISAAIQQAKQRAHQTGLGEDVLRFVQGDATSTDFLSDHPPVNLWLDIGCLHTLDSAGCATYAAHVRRLVAPQGTLLLYGWEYYEMDDRQYGYEESDVRSLFIPPFELIRVERGEETAVESRPATWYWLRRSEAY